MTWPTRGRPRSPRRCRSPSALSFTLGALLPLAAVLLPPASWRVPVCVLAVLAALALTGVVSARLGGANPRRPVLRVLIGGALGLAFTYGIGHLCGTAIGCPAALHDGAPPGAWTAARCTANSHPFGARRSSLQPANCHAVPMRSAGCSSDNLVLASGAACYWNPAPAFPPRPHPVHVPTRPERTAC